MSADGFGTAAIMAATETAKTTVWRWQARFMAEGVDGLLHDKTRPPGKPPVADDKTSTVVAMTLKPPPHEATHWTARAMAKVAGLAVSTVQKIWKVHGLAPHRWRQFKLSNDPAFAEKLHDVVGLYVSPPAHALVLSIDEKSQIQALDRTQPGLPMKKGRGATLTHDYKRNGTTTLFAALDVLTGEVFGRNMQRHRHQEFIRFLNALERDIPAGKIVHVILDNYAAHKHEKVRAWLDRHPRWTFHFTPTSSSWLNAVEGFFAILTRRRLQNGVFRSVVDLQAAINRFIAAHPRHRPHHRGDPRRLRWRPRSYESRHQRLKPSSLPPPPITAPGRLAPHLPRGRTSARWLPPSRCSGQCGRRVGRRRQRRAETVEGLIGDFERVTTSIVKTVAAASTECRPRPRHRDGGGNHQQAVAVRPPRSRHRRTSRRSRHRVRR